MVVHLLQLRAVQPTGNVEWVVLFRAVCLSYLAFCPMYHDALQLNQT